MPKNETERLNALKRYEILDTPPDGSFDRITSLASKMFNVPIAIITLVDSDRIWFKSAHGLTGVEQLVREPGLCASAIMAEDVTVVEDAKNDERTATNSLVSGDFGLSFYAAAPLKTKDGFNLGTVCLIDKKPRQLSRDEESMLSDLSGIVMDEMELRLAARKTAFKSEQRIAQLEKEVKKYQQN